MSQRLGCMASPSVPLTGANAEVKLVRNTGNDRVVDAIRPSLGAGRRLDVVTPSLSLFAFAELLPQLAAVGRCRFVLPPDDTDLLWAMTREEFIGTAGRVSHDMESGRNVFVP